MKEEELIQISGDIARSMNLPLAQMAEAFKQHQRYGDLLLRSPALELIQQFNRQQGQLLPTLHLTVEQITRSMDSSFYKSLQRISEALRDSMSLQSVLANIGRQNTDFLQSFKKIGNAIPNLISSLSMNSLRTMQIDVAHLREPQIDLSEMINSALAALATTALPSSFFVESLRQMPASEPMNPDELEPFLSDFDRAVGTRTDQLEPKRINYLGIAGIVLSGMFFVLSTYSSIRTKGEILDYINSRHRELSYKIDRLLPAQDTNTYYIVTEPVNLRDLPRSDAEVVSVLFPNQRAVLVDQDGDWLYVQYFDYVAAENKSGWVHSRYLKKL